MESRLYYLKNRCRLLIPGSGIWCCGILLTHLNRKNYLPLVLVPGEIALNPLFNFARRVFEGPGDFHRISRDIATHLFNQSLHPQIKPGELFVLYFSGIMLRGQQANAIGLFKSENKQSFLKVAMEKDFHMDIDEGISMDKMDKGCLIFDINEPEGFQLAIIDKSGKGEEAKFWKDDFLNVLPLNDNFQATKIVLDMAKKYVTGPLTEIQVVSKVLQVDSAEPVDGLF